MSKVTLKVDNNELVAYIDKDERPEGLPKVGTIPLTLKPGSVRELVQISGNIRVYNDKRDRAAFEQELRQQLERPYVLFRLFGEMGENPTTKQLNPSIHSRKQCGWLRSGETPATDNA